MRSVWCVVVAAVGCVGSAESVVTSDVDAPIRVTVYEYSNSQGPLAGAEVRFVAPDGTTQTTTTDATGVAEAVSPTGTTVAVFQMAEYHQRLVKLFYDVAPGDSISAGQVAQQNFPLLPDVTMVAPKRGGAEAYHFTVSCSYNNGLDASTRVAHVTNCPSAKDATVVVYAVDANYERMTSVSVLRHLDLTAVGGTTVRLPAYQQKNVSVTAQISNLPAGSANVQWSTSTQYGLDPTGFAGATMSASNGVNQQTLPDVGDRSVNGIAFTPPGYYDVSWGQFATSRLSNVTFDASATIRPAHGATFDPTLQRLDWTVAPYGRPGTISNFTLIAYDTIEQRDIRIDIHTPTDPTSVTLPELPPALAPRSTDRIMVGGSTTLIDGSSYRELMPIIDTGLANNVDLATFRGTVWRATIQ